MQPYKSIYLPNHPRAMSNGCVYEHILVAEQKLGRQLKDGECVHHIDENKRNNDPNNLIIFDSIGSHTSFHNCGVLIDNNDGTFSSNGKILYQMRKINNEKHRINNKAYKNNNIPSKEQLIDNLIESNINKSRVARLYNVSQTTIRHWCKRYKIIDCIYNINMSKPTEEREQI